MDAIATVRTRSHAERRFSKFRIKRHDEALLAEPLARFGWEKLVALPIGSSDRIGRIPLCSEAVDKNSGDGTIPIDLKYWR